MHIFVVPVSGGAYVSQLSILQHLSESLIKPDVILASSGGNVASYIALASEWKWSGMERIIQELDCSLFAKPWHNIPPLAFLMGVMKGNIYNTGSGVEDFFQRHYTSDSISQVEIWTGTSNVELQKPAIFCNKSSSILDVNSFNERLNNSCPLVFLSGDVDMISKVSVASASIPSIVPSQLINGYHYSDGGICGASPLTTMSDVIEATVRNKDCDLHIVYINSCNLGECENTEDGNLFVTWRQAMTALVRSQTTIDRKIAHSLVKRFDKPLLEISLPCNQENMNLIKTLKSRSRYTLLEIYPSKTYEVDITSFTGVDAVNKVRDAYNDCAMHLWYYSP